VSAVSPWMYGSTSNFFQSSPMMIVSGFAW
jgi:hypothetical protein